MMHPWPMSLISVHSVQWQGLGCRIEEALGIWALVTWCLYINYPLLNGFYAPRLKLSFQQSQEVNAV